MDPRATAVSRARAQVSGAAGETVIGARGPWTDHGATGVLRGADITVRRGEVVAPPGPGGAGGTTTVGSWRAFADASRVGRRPWSCGPPSDSPSRGGCRGGRPRTRRVRGSGPLERRR